MTVTLWALKSSKFGKSLQTKFSEWFTSFSSPDQLCEACIFGNNHRIPFVKQPWRAKFPLLLVHTNVCGPMNISSI